MFFYALFHVKRPIFCAWRFGGLTQIYSRRRTAASIESVACSHTVSRETCENLCPKVIQPVSSLSSNVFQDIFGVYPFVLLPRRTNINKRKSLYSNKYRSCNFNFQKSGSTAPLTDQYCRSIHQELQQYMKQTKTIELLDDRRNRLLNKTYTSYYKQTNCKVKLTFLSSGGATHYNK